MSACAILGELASFTKSTKDTILIKPNNQYINTDLSDERLNNLYSVYCSLLLEQYAEDCQRLKEHKDEM